MKKFISIMVILLLSITVVTGCGDDEKKEQVKPKKEPLVVAMELTYPPFETKDNKGNPIGVNVDFAQAFGEYIGRDIIIQETSYDQLLPSLQSGKSDIVISSLNITDEAKQVVDFSQPYANNRLAALVKNDSEIVAFDNLNQQGKKIAAVLDSEGYKFAQNNLSNAEIVVLPDENACILEVAQGKADGTIQNQLEVYNYWQANLETTVPMVISNQDNHLWAAAVQKGNTELLAQMNEFIETYRVNGGFNKLTNKYLAKEKESFDQLGFKWFFDLE